MTSTISVRGRARLAVVLLLVVGSWAAVAADNDADALSLQPPPNAEVAPSAGKLFIEAAVGQADQRYGLGSRTISRAAVDGRLGTRLTPSTQATVSARVDASDPADPRIDNAVLSLREAFVGWQDQSAIQVIELGRINLREGPGYGYNPTDFFRDNALRTISTENPYSLRENRMGSVMLRGQRLWPNGSFAVVYSPKLATSRSAEGFSLDLGSTNARDRGLVSLGSRLSEKVNTQITIYKEAGSSPRLGASMTALLSDAVVAHAEWSYSHEPDLLSHALQLPIHANERHRGVAGLTYTTTTRLSLTAEYQYNGFALDRDGWQALSQAGLHAQAAYFEEAVSLQDNAARNALLLYAVQRDLGLKNLDLTALVKLNRTDRSRMTWLDLRYRMDKFEIALQYQYNSGATGSEFGIAPTRSSTSIVGVLYF